MEEYKLFKIKSNGIETEFKILPDIQSTQNEIESNVNNIDKEIKNYKNTISDINYSINNLTNKADTMDYTIAVASGIITGLIDSFFVGKFDLINANKKSNKQVNDFILKYAKHKGYTGDSLNSAISFLEKKYPVGQDNIWKGANIGISAKDHHLSDIAHHPTILGLVAAIIVQFVRIGIFINKDGEWHIKKIDTSSKELLRLILPIVISGLLNWMLYIVNAHLVEKCDKEIPKPLYIMIKLLSSCPAAIEILKVTDNWIGHLVSDMGGSKNTAGGGMGIPGLFLSLLKEISGMPILKNTGLPEFVNKSYVTEKMDMRKELAIVEELGKQAIPVLLGEVFVRGFYFVRHLLCQLKEHSNKFDEIDWNDVRPWGNRTIARMLSISSGAFIAVDTCDAIIRSKGNCTDFILHINFVGIGRFVIAVGIDIGMGVKKRRLEIRRLYLYNQLIKLYNADIFYKQAEMWIAAKDAGEAIEKAYNMIIPTLQYYKESFNEMDYKINSINDYIQKAAEKNPSLKIDILNRLDEE